MKKTTHLLVAFTLATYFSQAQIGINNTNPQSVLDISSSSTESPSTTDGILIPRIDDFPATDPTLAQDGMMVFLNQDVGTDAKGFYYWDGVLDRWISIGAEEWKDGVNSTGDNLIYASQAKLSGTDVVITDDGRIGFGTSDPIERFEFKGPGDNDFQITSAYPQNPPNLILTNTGGTLESPALMPTNNEIGSLVIKTTDGSQLREVGGVRIYVDGTPTATSLPTRFAISNTPENSVNQMERLTIRQNGNIGIGETDPSARLDVNGSARVRNLTAGPVYSDANGNLSNTAVGPRTVAAGLVQGNGTAIKIYGATVSRIDEGDYQVTFSTPRASANYVINLANVDCGGNCAGSGGTYDDPGIGYYDRTAAGFKINIGDSDNGSTAKDDIDIEFSFSVIDF